MAHPEGEAVDSPAPVSVEEKAADFEQFLGDEYLDGELPEEGEEPDEVEETEGEEADDDFDLEDDEESDEPETAIEAPVSLNAEEKEVFAQLPPEAQQAWAASETRRNTQVQEATTKASTAQREAEARAAAADAEAKAQYADQLDQFIAAFEPQAPDPMLAQQDPQSYIAQKAQFDAMKAQHDELVQRVKAVKSEANTEAQQAFIQQRDRELMAIPEVANPDTRQNYLDTAFGAAEWLGYDKGELAQSITANEVQKLYEIAQMRTKAEKYDQAMSKRMKKVRAAKGKTLRPNAAPQGKSRSAKASQAWKGVKEARGNKAAEGAAMAEWLEASGHL